MRRVLLDQNVPAGLRFLLPADDVRTAFRMGWAELSNGDLLATADASGFELLITCDQDLPYQQNLAGRRMAVLVLGTNRWAVIRAHSADIDQVVAAIQPGSFSRLPL